MTKARSLADFISDGNPLADGTIAVSEVSGAAPLASPSFTGNIAVTGNVDGRDVAADGTKLDGIETSATADQTDAEIRTAVEAATDSNVFTDADHSKLNAIEASATADQSDAEIRTAVEAATDSNVFTDADHTKLNAIEASADVTDTVNVVAALTAGSNITIASDGTIAGAAQYTHPTHAGDDAAIDTGALSGATVISDLDLNITTDTLGHVTDANATVATRNLTLANLGYTGATNANYITNNNQLTNGAGYTTSVGDITGVTAGSGISGGGTSGTVTVSHADTSSQGSVNNSGSTFIQDVTVDTYGHITGLTSATVPASGMSKTSTLVSSSGTQSTQVDLSNDLKGSESTFSVGSVPFGDFSMTGQLPSNNRFWTFDPNTTSSSRYGSFNVEIAAGGVTSVQYKSGVILLAYYSSVFNTTTALAKMLNQGASNQYTQPPAISCTIPSGEIGTGDYFVVAAGRMINGGGYAAYEAGLAYAANKVTIIGFTQGLS